MSRGAEVAAIWHALLACLCNESGGVFFAVTPVGKMLVNKDTDGGAKRRIRIRAIAPLVPLMPSRFTERPVIAD